MNGKQYSVRQSFLAEIHAAMDARLGMRTEEFRLKLEGIVCGLESLTLEAEQKSVDRLERARNWRLLGNVRLVLAAGGQGEWLGKARAALERSEAMLAEIEIPEEKLKLAYSFGLLLQEMWDSDQADLSCLQKAIEYYKEALRMARAEKHRNTTHIERAVYLAERELALRKRYDSIMAEIDYRRGRRSHTGGNLPASHDHAFSDEELLQEYLKLYMEIRQMRTRLSEYQGSADKAMLWL